MKYFSEMEDTLLGLFIHWIPFQFDNSDKNFLLRVWGDNAGVPGSELIENFEFHNPNYYHDGYNIFSYYEYDQPVAVDGTFYVGWVQDNNSQLNVGNDKNTNSNPAKLFYNLGIGSSWTQSIITGSVMIRPVFKSGKTNVWNNIGENSTDIFMLFPNPAENTFHVNLRSVGQHQMALLDAAGRIIQTTTFNGGGMQTVDISSISEGIYYVQITDVMSGIVSTQKLIVQ
jgi:hypothetical protein